MRGYVNLCDAERSRRLRLATVGLALVVIQMTLLAEVAAAPLWWATLALPLAIVSLQIAQAYTGVCVKHARAGTRSYGRETEPILDPRKRQMVRQRARRVLGVALLLTILSTSIVMAVVSLR